MIDVTLQKKTLAIIGCSTPDFDDESNYAKYSLKCSLKYPNVVQENTLTTSYSEIIELVKLKAIACSEVNVIKREPNRKCCKVVNAKKIRSYNGYIGKSYVGHTENRHIPRQSENTSKMSKDFIWKGRTFSEVISVIRKNEFVLPKNISSRVLRKPLPLKHYRRELQLCDTVNCRGGSSFREYNTNSSSIIECKMIECNARQLARSVGKYTNEYIPGTSDRHRFSSNAEYIHNRIKKQSSTNKNRDAPVSSSSRLSKLKYDTFANNGLSKANINIGSSTQQISYVYDKIGQRGVNSLAYGTKNTGYY
jgi:hypothetical protein